jgi:hypothetical protein
MERPVSPKESEFLIRPPIERINLGEMTPPDVSTEVRVRHGAALGATPHKALLSLLTFAPAQSSGQWPESASNFVGHTRLLYTICL